MKVTETKKNKCRNCKYRTTGVCVCVKNESKVGKKVGFFDNACMHYKEK